MARAANIALKHKNQETFYQAKIATARFYANNFLPQAIAFSKASTTGADDILAISSDFL